MGLKPVAQNRQRRNLTSDLQESFVLHLDDRGNIAALDYSTPSGECELDEILPPTKCAASPRLIPCSPPVQGLLSSATMGARDLRC